MNLKISTNQFSLMVFFLLVLFSLNSSAQENENLISGIRIINKKDTTKQIIHTTGDIVTVYSNHAKTRGKIQTITDTSLTVAFKEFKFSEIEVLKFQNEKKLSQGVFLIILGVASILIGPVKTMSEFDLFGKPLSQEQWISCYAGGIIGEASIIVAMATMIRGERYPTKHWTLKSY